MHSIFFGLKNLFRNRNPHYDFENLHPAQQDQTSYDKHASGRIINLKNIHISRNVQHKG